MTTLFKDLESKLKYRKVSNFPEDGVMFYDFTSTFSDVKLMKEISSVFSDYILKEYGNIDYIIMPQSRGYIIGSYLASYMNVDTIPILKYGKLPRESVLDSYVYKTEYSLDCLDLPNLNIDLKDKKCIFIDDVFATGGTYDCCKSMIEAYGGKVLCSLTILDVGISNNQENKSIMRLK